MKHERNLPLAGVVTVVCLCGWWCPPSQAGVPKGKAPSSPTPSQLWELPKDADASALALRASPDFRFLYFNRRRIAKDAKPVLSTASREYVMMDTKSGETIGVVAGLLAGENIRGLSGGAGELEFSPSGDHVLVHAVSTLFCVKLKTRKYVKLPAKAKPERSCSLYMGEWIGDRVAVTRNDLTGKWLPVEIYSPLGRKVKELKLCGPVIAADPKGKFMVVQADPKKPGVPIHARQVLQRGKVLVVDAEGRILRDLGQANFLPGKYTALSRDGKYVAFTELGPRQSTKTTVTVLATSGSAKWSINDMGEPIHVRNNGLLLTKGLEPYVHKDGVGLRWSVKAWDAKGNPRPVMPALSGIIDVCVAGGRIHYAKVGKTGTIVVRWIKLDD